MNHATTIKTINECIEEAMHYDWDFAQEAEEVRTDATIAQLCAIFGI